MVPEELIGTLGDTHIYLNQIESVKEHITRENEKIPELPTLEFSEDLDFNLELDDLLEIIKFKDLKLIDYNPLDVIKHSLNN